jgi:hypothetical protein
MTRHKALHTGLRTPSPPDRWINVLLCGLAMLMSHAAHLCSMRLIRPPAECHSDATPEVLPCEESGKLKEPTRAAGSSHTPRESASSSNAFAIATESAIARSPHPEDEVGASRTRGLEGRGRAHKPLNESSSGSSRGSRLARRRNLSRSPRPSNRDSRDKPENDPWLVQ